MPADEPAFVLVEGQVEALGYGAGRESVSLAWIFIILIGDVISYAQHCGRNNAWGLWEVKGKNG